MDAETRVNAAREAMEQARMVAQESRVRREGLVEQFAASARGTGGFGSTGKS